MTTNSRLLRKSKCLAFEYCGPVKKKKKTPQKTEGFKMKEGKCSKAAVQTQH